MKMGKEERDLGSLDFGQCGTLADLPGIAFNQFKKIREESSSGGNVQIKEVCGIDEYLVIQQKVKWEAEVLVTFFL